MFMRQPNHPIKVENMTDTAILVMAYGTPDSVDDIEPYLTDIRRGRKPTPEVLEELKGRYLKIGGRSPLLEITRAQASAIEKQLGSRGVNTRVYVGMKHWHPYIREVIPKIIDDGYSRIVGLVLAPHYSQISIGGYEQALQEALAQSDGLNVDFVEYWYDHPLFHQAVKERIEDAFTQFSEPEKVELLFTAHSLPERILTVNDPYPTQLASSCHSVGDLVGRKDWSFAFQSAGKTDEKWLGPDIIEYLRDLQSTAHPFGVLVVPIGFVADHLEILYDIDVEAQEFARSIGLQLKRIESLNTSPTFISALTDIVSKRLRSG
jgi:ferrochelatase